MAQIIKLAKPKLEVADVFRQHIKDYQQSYHLWAEHFKVVSDLDHCRTAYLGGHIERCNNCGTERIMYHSCRNRHCPKCQQIPREKWLQTRKEELLPVDYFHVVFTLPHELNPIILSNKYVMFNILFKAASQTLLTFGKNELGGKLGFVAVLHTWDQQLKDHFHLHCLVAGGAVCSKNKRWIPCKNNYLFNQEALSLVFRGKYIDFLTQTIQKGKLSFNEKYQQFKDKLYTHKWVVSVQDPMKQAEHVLEYLARYTYRVAIANSRLVALDDGMVTFRYKDRKNNRLKHNTISAVEFIRRFLLHTLPKGFIRIRHYGFLANRNRKTNLNHIRRLLNLPRQLLKTNASLKEMMLKLTGVDITQCPSCNNGRMKLVTEIPRCRARSPDNLACALG